MGLERHALGNGLGRAKARPPGHQQEEAEVEQRSHLRDALTDGRWRLDAQIGQDHEHHHEYIDERFPHPQLMPGDPVDRARVRLFLLNFEKELFVHVNTLESRASKGNEKALEKARAHIRDRLTQLAPVFLKNKYMLGEGFSMLDVAIAPLLWRLDYYGIELSKNAAPLLKYAERIFSRPAYIEALTPSEKVMRK